MRRMNIKKIILFFSLLTRKISTNYFSYLSLIFPFPYFSLSNPHTSLSLPIIPHPDLILPHSSLVSNLFLILIHSYWLKLFPHLSLLSLILYLTLSPSSPVSNSFHLTFLYFSPPPPPPPPPPSNFCITIIFFVSVSVNLHCSNKYTYSNKW